MIVVSGRGLPLLRVLQELEHEPGKTVEYRPASYDELVEIHTRVGVEWKNVATHGDPDLALIMARVRAEQASPGKFNPTEYATQMGIPLRRGHVKP